MKTSVNFESSLAKLDNLYKRDFDTITESYNKKLKNTHNSLKQDISNNPTELNVIKDHYTDVIKQINSTYQSDLDNLKSKAIKSYKLMNTESGSDRWKRAKALVKRIAFWTVITAGVVGSVCIAGHFLPSVLKWFTGFFTGDKDVNALEKINHASNIQQVKSIAAKENRTISSLGSSDLIDPPQIDYIPYNSRGGVVFYPPKDPPPKKEPTIISYVPLDANSRDALKRKIRDLSILRQNNSDPGPARDSKDTSLDLGGLDSKIKSSLKNIFF
jgi:hypothetical protein